MRTALLIGTEPPVDLGCRYTQAPPYDQIVIGSLTLGQLLYFHDERVLEGLAQGMPVYLYTPGLPVSPKNRVLFTDGGRKRLITAQEAKQLRLEGRSPGPGAVLTPLAKEILEDTK